MIIIQPSASRTTNPRAPIPSSKLLGYYHSSALRTDNSTFWAKPIRSEPYFIGGLVTLQSLDLSAGADRVHFGSLFEHEGLNPSPWPRRNPGQVRQETLAILYL